MNLTGGGDAYNIWCRVAKNRAGRTTPWPAKMGDPNQGDGAIKLQFTPSQTRFATGGDYAR